MPGPSLISSLDIATLTHVYQAGEFSPLDVLAVVLERLAAYSDPAVWIHLPPQDEALLGAAVQKRWQTGESLPLYGIPFAIKDNIDLAGHPTTAGCPAFSYVAKRSAPVVQRLLDAGAIVVGKTNLDQFAAGLAGDRSPYGACRNVFDPLYISGGSSSGSAVAVAAGLVSFALGTDTAGSGRVPAGCNNIVGTKPTPGLPSAVRRQRRSGLDHRWTAASILAPAEMPKASAFLGALDKRLRRIPTAQRAAPHPADTFAVPRRPGFRFYMAAMSCGRNCFGSRLWRCWNRTCVSELPYRLPSIP